MENLEKQNPVRGAHRANKLIEGNGNCIDTLEHTPNQLVSLAAEHIAKRYRLSEPHARVASELDGFAEGGDA